MKRLIFALIAALAIVSCATDNDTSFGPGRVIVASTYAYDSCTTAASNGELCVEGDVETQANLDVAGTADIAGLVTATGGQLTPVLAVTTTAALTSADCGKVITVSAGIDTKSITLQAAVDGCVYTFVYIGADGGALVDISPNAADGIHGSCTLAASVLEFSGADDADIGLTKGTVNTGDTITLASDGAIGWYVTACTGIWANN